MIEKLSEILGIDLLQKSKREEVVWARFACFYLLRKNGFTSLEIGKMLGKHHATVLHGAKRFEEMLGINDPIAVRFWSILENFKVNRVETVRISKIKDASIEI